MNENEPSTDLHRENRDGEALSDVGAKLPTKAGEKANGKVPPEQERISLRFREGFGRKRLLLGGALLLLLAIVLTVTTLVGRGKEGGETTDTSEETETAESTSESEPLYLYGFDPSLVPEGHVAFRPLDLSGERGALDNRTEHAVDPIALLRRFSEAYSAEPTPILGDAPIVLILHTHSTEGYSPEGAISWDGEGELGRSESPDENVTKIGKVLADALCAAGIPAISSDAVHDRNGDTVTNVGAYARAAETVQKLCEAYPSIRYVIDLHRDVVCDGEGNVIRAVAPLNGTAAAQVGITVAGGAHDAWEDSLSLALALADALNAEGASLARTTVLDGSDGLGGAVGDRLLLQLDVGTAANTLAEAERSAEYVGIRLAELIAAIESSRAEG